MTDIGKGDWVLPDAAGAAKWGPEARFVERVHDNWWRGRCSTCRQIPAFGLSLAGIKPRVPDHLLCGNHWRPLKRGGGVTIIERDLVPVEVG